MIARIWTGAVRKADGDTYAQYMRETGVAGYAGDARQPGNLQATHYDVAAADAGVKESGADAV